MISLPNGCQRSQIKVTPKNWNITPSSAKGQASLVAKNWRIYYRFYDPAFKGTRQWGQMIPIKGMNCYKDLVTRQEITKTLISDEADLIDKQGFNPITKKYCMADPAPEEAIEEITPTTPFIPALKKALEMLTVGDMKSDLKSIIKGIEVSASKLTDQATRRPYTALSIADITRKHIIYTLKQCAKDNPRFSPYRQNKYRTGLLMLYKQLLAVEAVDTNPIHDIPIQKGHVKKRPKLLTAAECLIVDTNLKAWDYHYWRYMRIFFRSGSRSTELLSLKNDGNIDLEKQEFTIIVKKGVEFKEDFRPIPDDIVDLWIEVVEETKPGEHLFSTHFKPGPVKIGKDNPNKKWAKYVKNDPGKYDPFQKGWGLGIKKDFYKLKTLNTDTIAGKLDMDHAAAADGHTDTKTTRKYYTPNETQRMVDKLKKVEVKFA